MKIHSFDSAPEGATILTRPPRSRDYSGFIHPVDFRVTSARFSGSRNTQYHNGGSVPALGVFVEDREEITGDALDCELRVTMLVQGDQGVTKNLGILDDANFISTLRFPGHPPVHKGTRVRAYLNFGEAGVVTKRTRGPGILGNLFPINTSTWFTTHRKLQNIEEPLRLAVLDASKAETAIYENYANPSAEETLRWYDATQQRP